MWGMSEAANLRWHRIECIAQGREVQGGTRESCRSYWK